MEVASIVIPVFNRADMTQRCLERLAATVDPADVELIVVDNGSSDGSAELVRRLWPSAVVLRNDANRGFAKGCNQGVAAARAEQVILLNNDTEPSPGWLAALLAPLQDRNVAIVAPKLLFPDGTLQHAGMYLVEDRKNGLVLNAVHRHYGGPATLAEANRPQRLQLVTGAVLAMRRAVFDELGGFDEGYWNGCEDVDLCLRAQAYGYAVVYEPAAVLLHHESASGAERWTKVNDNLRRLATKWAGRVTPDLVVTAEGNVVPIDGRPLPDPQGGLRVALDGAAFLYHSLSQVNRELSVRLAAEHGMDVVVRSTVVPEVGPAADDRLLPVAAASAAQPPLRPQVTIRHQWPPDWSAPADDSPVVVVQPWEFGGLPDDWIEPLTTWPDEIWCYTNWVRDCYVRSGVPADRLFVLPIGVDTERFTPDGPRLQLRTAKRTRLLFVGGLIHRKGVDVLLRAYQRAFSAADDVCLVVKSFGAEGVYRHAGQFDLLREAMAQPGGPEIELISDDLDQVSMAALYRACDVLVHPYRGEGFGMPIAEAMASGLAVVVTGDGAAADFCDESTALLIPSRRVAVSPGSVGLPPSRAGYWFAEPDEDALVACLRQVVQEGDTRRQRADRGRRRVHETLVWSDIAAVAAARLQALAARPARRLVAEDPYHPGARPHPLDHPRDRTVLVVAGPERPGWQQVVASAAAAVGVARDVTLVVAAEATGDRARQAVLDSLSDLLDGTDADVLVVLDAEPPTLAGLMVATDLTVAGDAQLTERAQRCGTDVVAPAESALRAWAGTTSHPSAA